MKILCLGDIVGKPGRMALEALLDKIIQENQIDFTVINGENAAGGSGISSRIAKFFFRLGADVITLGDHTWDQNEVEFFLNKEPNIIRPDNFPDGAPGRGWCIKQTNSGARVGVVNLIGRTFMKHQVECPFRRFDSIYNKIKIETDIIILDFHAETTSEKVAMGHYADGRASIVFGTHTHIQTADETVLPEGTGYITDLGMSGPYDSVIGQRKDLIIQRFLTQRPVKFQMAEKGVKLCGVIAEVDSVTGKTQKIQRIQKEFQEEG